MQTIRRTIGPYLIFQDEVLSEDRFGRTFKGCLSDDQAKIFAIRQTTFFNQIKSDTVGLGGGAGGCWRHW